MMKASIGCLALALALGGCSSAVKLDETANGAAAASNAASTTSENAVAPVDSLAGAPDLAGPPGVGQVVYFDFDSYVIKPEFQGLVERHAHFLKNSPQRRTVLQGHTDARGGREYNLALGQRRAEAVRRALGLLGVNDARIEAISFGKEKPAVPGVDEASHAQNRRVEIKYR